MGRRTRGGLFAVLAVLAIGGAVAVQSTVAAWTDPAHVGATASAGTWVTAPTPSCVVRDSAGHVIRNCTARATIAAMWQQVPGAPWTIQYSVSLTQEPGDRQYAEVVIDLSKATGTLPPGFTWTLAGIAGGWNIDTTGTRCADLPLVTGRIGAYQSSAGIHVVQDRTTQGPLTCT